MATPESNPLDAASPLVSSQTLAVAAGSALRNKYTKELHLLRLAENRAKRGIKLVRAKLEVLNDFERRFPSSPNTQGQTTAPAAAPKQHGS